MPVALLLRILGTFRHKVVAIPLLSTCISLAGMLKMLAGTDLTKAAGPDTIKLKWHKIIFKKSLDSGQIPIGKRQLLHLLNQRTGGPVNAHLTHGPVIYFNAFIHVYSPRAGADNPFGTNVDVNRKPLSLCPFVASFKTICLKYDFKNILNDFIHIYSPRQGQTTPWGQNFDGNRNSLPLCPFVASLKISLRNLILYTFLM